LRPRADTQDKAAFGLEMHDILMDCLIEAFQDIMQFATLLPFKVKNWKYEFEKQKSWYLKKCSMEQTTGPFKYHTFGATCMVTTESEKKFHKQKAVDALERMKKAVNNEDLKDANRQEGVFDHHLDEMARLQYYEEDES
jgi:hypothetical protein